MLLSGGSNEHQLTLFLVLWPRMSRNGRAVGWRLSGTLVPWVGEPYFLLPCRCRSKHARLHTSPIPSTWLVKSLAKVVMASAGVGGHAQPCHGGGGRGGTCGEVFKNLGGGGENISP